MLLNIIWNWNDATCSLLNIKFRAEASGRNPIFTISFIEYEAEAIIEDEDSQTNGFESEEGAETFPPLLDQ